MAAVWLARLRGKHGFQKFVAVKMIRPEHASDQRFQAMFLDEARIAAAITHPNVAQITDLGEENGVLYIAMEWIDGDSLSKLLRVVQRAGHRLPLGVALRILADTCGGLHAAHEQRGEDGQLTNVVHRDVSPTNVSFCPTKARPRSSTSALQKRWDAWPKRPAPACSKGKISYMSPEQALGRGNVDRRADVWAIGSVLHMALAGSPPFRAENEVLALHRLTSGKPPDPLPPDVPPAVRTIVARAMAFNVDQRTPDCATLQAELESAMVACGCMTTAADVAAFTGHYLADSARTRQEMVQRAIAAASDRERGGRPADALGNPERDQPDRVARDELRQDRIQRSHGSLGFRPVTQVTRVTRVTRVTMADRTGRVRASPGLQPGERRHSRSSTGGTPQPSPQDRRRATSGSSPQRSSSRCSSSASSAARSTRS